MKKVYSRDFKVDLCKSVIAGDLSHNEAALKYEISSIMLYRWISEYKQKGDMAFCGKGSLLAVNAELSKLREENEKLKLENRELLLKADVLEKQNRELLQQMKQVY